MIIDPSQAAPRKPSLRITPNPILCAYSGALMFGATCYMHDRDRAHVDCWRRHFGGAS